MSCDTSKSVPLVAATWGEIEHTTRVFAGLHASLADPTLPIPAAVRASMPAFTWAHVIDVLRVTQSSKWREGTGFCKSAVGHHALWLLLGSDMPLPVKASNTLTGALTAALAKPFEEEALAEAKRAKKLGLGPTCCLPAARVTVAQSMRWSAPADLVLLRYLMIDAKDATRKLRDSTAASAPRPAAPPSLPASSPLATTELPAEAKGLQLRRSDSHVSGYVGVLKLNNGRFAARSSRQVSLGTFDTAVDAAVACAANEQEGCFCRKGCGNSFIGDKLRIRHEQNCLGHAAVEDDGERPSEAEGLQLHMSNNSGTSYKGVQKDSAGFFGAHLGKPANNHHAHYYEYLGKFDTAVEAAVAYARAAIRANSLAAVVNAQAEVEAQAEARNVLRTRHENSSTGQVKDGPREQPKGKGKAKAAPVPASAPAVKAPARQQGTASKKRSLVVLVDAAGVPWYEVDTLLAVRQKRDCGRNSSGLYPREFLVRWRGYSPADDSWEAESNIDEGLVQAFASADRGAKAPGASASGTTLLNSADAKVPARRKRRVVAPVHQAGDASSATGPPAWLSGVQKVQRVGDHYQASLPACAALPAEGSTATDAPVRVCRNTLEQQAARDSAAQLTATAFGLDAFSFVAPCDCGLGLFARVPLRAGQFVSEYDGPRLPQRLQVRGRYVLQVPGTSTVIDGASENSPFECERSLAVYANHSSRPNARLECRPPLPQQGIPRMLLVAVEPIEAGQEVRIDYEDGAAGEAVYWADGPPSETAWHRVRLHPPPPTLEEPSYARLDEWMESTTARRPTLPWEGPTGGDARLQALVTLFSISNHQATGACDWQLVSTHLPGRSWRECRERWLFMQVADGHAAWLTSPAKASISHTEAAAAMAEAHRAAANKAAMEAAGEERVGEGLARCCILGCTEQLLQCNGQKHAGCEVGCAENWHVICAPCLDRWHSSQAALRDKFGLSKQNRRTCPVCKAELRAAGSTMRGVADQYAMGLQKVAGTWR